MLKHDGFVLIHQHTIFCVQAHCFGQHSPFHVATLADHITRRIAVVSVDDILSNDWPFVQVLGNIMSGCSDDLDTTLEGLVIRIRSNKRREKAVMDIDNLVRISVHKTRLQYLHIAGEHEEIYFAPEEIEHMHLIFLAMLFPDRKVVVRNMIALCNRLQVRMIAENAGNFHWQLTAVPTPE